MDRKIFFLLIILINQFYFSQSKVLSKIDNLETTLEVESFIRSQSKDKRDYLSQFELRTIERFDDNNLSKKIKRSADSLGINKSFYKGDFNHDGRTDLIFIGDDKSCQSSRKNSDGTNSCNTSTKVFFDLGNTYILKNLQPNHSDFVIPVISKINGQDYITVFFEEFTEDLEASTFRYNSKIISKTLDYKFDNFVEYNPYPTSHFIQKIEYSTDMCYGTCPMFNIVLNKNGRSTFIAKAFNFIDNNNPRSQEKAYKALNKNRNEGSFEAQLNVEDFAKIETILNYINFSTLSDNYFVNWTDDQTSNLKITYNNGEIKTIEDYGLSGTYGLKLLYKKLFAIRFSQEWKKIK